MKKVLTIAGSDCSGGAGIQADLKTILVHGHYGMSVITAVTAQNTLGVNEVFAVPASTVGSQIDAIFTDIRPEAVKIGMVSNKDIADVIADRLEYYRGDNIVIDPVMVSTSGRKLLDDAAIVIMKERLFKMASVITPNIPEAQFLSNTDIITENDMKSAAVTLADSYGCAVLIKGGHSVSNCNDLLYKEGNFYWYRSEKISNNNLHGTGCTLSSAIACNLASGCDLIDSVRDAKEYLTGAIRDGLDIGRGNGPLNHFYGHALNT